MSLQPNKNLIKKLFSIVGVATASVALSVPAFALPNAEANRSNQVSSNQLLAQASPTIGDPSDDDLTTPANLRQNDRTSSPSQIRDRSNQMPMQPNQMQMQQRAPFQESQNLDQRSNWEMRGGADATYDVNDRANRRLVTGGDSVRGVIFRCLNNPNPYCG